MRSPLSLQFAATAALPDPASRSCSAKRDSLNPGGSCCAAKGTTGAAFGDGVVVFEGTIHHPASNFELQMRAAWRPSDLLLGVHPVASVLDMTATLTDQAIDLFDRLVGSMFRKAEGRQARAFQADARAINEKVRVYARIGSALIVTRDTKQARTHGAGEWLVEKHGVRTRRSWRRLRLGVDADTGQIVAALTSKEVDDAVQIGLLLDQFAGGVYWVTADGAQDQDDVRRRC